MGIESNNVAEVEGLLQGIQMAKEYNWTPLIVEVDSQMVIQMETKIHQGNSSAKVANSWQLEGILERLEKNLDPRMAVTFNHAKRNNNKVRYMMDNLRIETQRSIKARD